MTRMSPLHMVLALSATAALYNDGVKIRKPSGRGYYSGMDPEEIRKARSKSRKKRKRGTK